MSQFDFASASAAGEGLKELDRSISYFSDVSSTGGSQPDFSNQTLPIFEIGNDEIITLNPNGQVVSNSRNPSPFVEHVNDTTRQFYQKILETVDEDISEDDAATEISTGLTKTINVEEGSPLKRAIGDVIDQYSSNITMIAQNTFDPPDLSVFSQDSARTQNSASTISALSVLEQLTQPQIITPIVNLAIETKNAISKKKIASEVVDLTITGCDYKQTTIEKTLENNNRFGILKFCSANGIPISGNISNGGVMNEQTEKIFYSIKELEWMLEQDASTKGSTRVLRLAALLFCLKNRSAMDLFDIIYNMLYATQPDAFIKICAVGGNVLRAFFLALRFARNIANGAPNLPPDDRCTALDDLSPEQTVELGRFANAIPELDKLCKKASDTDLTGIEQLSEAEKAECEQTMKNTLHLLCLPLESRPAKYIEMGGKNQSFILKCRGAVKFPLIRMKAVTYEDDSYYESKCGSIADNTETMKWANYFFRKIKWFAQMIPDDPVESLDEFSKQQGYLNADGTYANETFAKFYPEIRKLYCTIQEVKKHNAAMTSVNSDEISQGSFNHLITFTTGCCQIFFDTIGPNVKDDDFKNIYNIVRKITPLASRAMFSLLENPIIQPYITRVLQRLNDTTYLASPDFLEKYGTNVRILTDETGNPVPVKSTCIAVSSAVFGVSSIHKESSAQIRHLFSEFYKSNPSHPFNQNLSMTVNCLEFDDPNGAIDDLKEAGEQPANTAIIDLKESTNKYKKPSETKSNKTLKMKEPKEKTTKETITVGELKQIIKNYNADKTLKDKIKGYTNINDKNALFRLLLPKGITFGGAKTRKRKPRKTRKIRKNTIA